MGDVTGRKKQSYVELRTDDGELVRRLIDESFVLSSSRIELSREAELYVLVIIPTGAASTFGTGRDCEHDEQAARL
jgi:hypothetical protein